MIQLESLKNATNPRKRKKLLGRGPGSRRGKTCARGHKGAGSRSGWKSRMGREGGGVPLYRRTPTRGFSNARFAKKLDVINLEQIETLFHEGETVSLETLREKRYIQGHSHGIKILGHGSLRKKVTVKVDAISSSAREKMEKLGIQC